MERKLRWWVVLAVIAVTSSRGSRCCDCQPPLFFVHGPRQLAMSRGVAKLTLHRVLVFHLAPLLFGPLVAHCHLSFRATCSTQRQPGDYVLASSAGTRSLEQLQYEQHHHDYHNDDHQRACHTSPPLLATIPTKRDNGKTGTP